MSGPVPIASSLSDIYTEQSRADQAVRWNNLLERFQSLYGRQAEFVSRSPGRVNIIGEHIDYSLYSVLPMGMTPDVIIAVAADVAPAKEGTYRVKIANVDEEKFPTREFDIPYDEVEIDATKHEWTNYFKSGLRGALELLRKKKGASFKPTGVQVLMDGTVPAGGGLSSSAAFVSASALAVMVANGEKQVDKKELTELAIVSERAVGVNSGGMDQAASVFSERGSALFVSFSPSLSARPVFFPKTNPELIFLIANSFVTSNKQVTGPVNYNLRVVECSLAAEFLNAKFNPKGTTLPADAAPLGVSLHGFHETYFKSTDKTASQQLEQLISIVKSTLTQEEGYTREEIASVIGLSIDELHQRFTAKIPVRAERFKLRQRALHVFSEALRVLKFMSLLEDSSQIPSSGGDTTAYNAKLGELLNETQESSVKLFENSCPEVDEICAIAREAGSYGSRVTGAGWGGCSVHLVPADKVGAIKKALVDKYYTPRGHSAKEIEDGLVVSRPMNGSALYWVSDGKLE